MAEPVLYKGILLFVQKFDSVFLHFCHRSFISFSRLKRTTFLCFSQRRRSVFEKVQFRFPAVDITSADVHGGLLRFWQQRTTWSLYHPSPHWGGEENGKKKAKLVGRGKGSLAEQQTRQTVTTTILIRRIYKTNCKMHRSNSQHPMLRTLPSCDCRSPVSSLTRNPA